MVTPIDMSLATQISVGGSNIVERLLQCPNQDCQRLFIARYIQGIGSTIFQLRSCVPNELRKEEQTETISKISTDFCSIYDEAHKAEQYGLALIAGPGYRKALEFLIKDYIVSKIVEEDPEKKAAQVKVVRETFLGKCIGDFVRNDNIKEMAKRAVWLGNDETHYERKWETKDVSDLKKLISATKYWIEMETLTADVISDMPQDKS